MKFLNALFLLFFGLQINAQTINVKLANAIASFEKDEQFRHAITAMYVVNSNTGAVVFEHNAQTGVAPASCQKVITSVSAFEMLGNNFRYKTYLMRDPFAADDEAKQRAGSLFIVGQGDPTLGSWRWKSTADTAIFLKIAALLKKNNFISFERNLYISDLFYGSQPVPDGWIWQDMGNYYGAPCFGFNWHENQYDMALKTGAQKGWPTDIVSVKPELPAVTFQNNIKTGAKGSADNGYIYAAPYSNYIVTEGTVPQQEKLFSISGSMPDPAAVFKERLLASLKHDGITVKGKALSYSECIRNNIPYQLPMRFIDSILSPPLDSINYWFLKKSVNLFGEAFLKAIAVQKYSGGIGNGIYDTAIGMIKNFWSRHGIDKDAINIIDGSGLSTASRVTTHALVTVMQYARDKAWFNSFYNALPEINSIKMKDGYINGVRSYTGYIKSKDGPEYTFSFIVNNFDGSAGTVREKMWRVLDLMK
jgi:D-alanyl-D-alanine carboxypeptidase/D-alanyl-D-alanine-endopeptidase (penicillin-binding protein 4)